MSKIICYNITMLQLLFRKKRKAATNPHYLQNREHARMVITARVEHYASLHGFTYNRIAIRDTRTRWGSCSSKGNLNFNYRLAFMDRELLDYVVVHELCHLIHMNHSKDYWAEVAKIMPDYEQKKKRLRGVSSQTVID